MPELPLPLTVIKAARWLQGIRVSLTGLATIVALLLSAATFYRTFLYQHEELMLSCDAIGHFMGNHELPDSQNGLFLSLVVTNSGNREETLEHFQLILFPLNGSVVPPYPSVGFVPELTDKLPLVMKPNDRREISARFPMHVDFIAMAFGLSGSSPKMKVHVVLNTTAVTFRGKSVTSYYRIGSVPLELKTSSGGRYYIETQPSNSESIMVNLLTKTDTSPSPH